MKRLPPIILSMLALLGCEDSNNETSSDLLPNVDGTPSLASVYTYQNDETSEQVLSCSTLFLVSDSCDVEDIKPIGATVSEDISLEDIKGRLVISHDWMADSFIAALEEINDQDFLNLFKPLNTIVLSYEIIPSFYHRYTASIYIDARYLWRNTEEWSTIYQQEDYRSDYRDAFIFATVARYIDATTSEYVLWSNSYNVDSYNTRTASQVAPALFRLLSHELAHANDYIPSELLNSLGASGKIYDDYILPHNNINDELNESIPLTSESLSDIAQVSYGGSDITEQMKETTGADIGDAFSDDGAASLYSYYTDAEDVAMLFEAFMMYKKYGAVSDIGFVSLPLTDDYSCDDYKVEWGQRHRLADDNVKQRTLLIGSRILDRDISEDLNTITSGVITIEENTGWCTSRTTTAAVSEVIESSVKGIKSIVVHDYRDDFVLY